MPRLFGDGTFGSGFFGDDFGDVPPSGTGPGNGGEAFRIKLAPNGTIETATLATSITPATGTLVLTSDGTLPATGLFCLTVEDEVLCVRKVSAGLYRITHRALSNTVAAAHTAGVTVSWNDTYDMAIESQVNVSADVFWDDDLTTYPGWIFAFDSSQAYLSGDLYPAHVSQLLGVFTAGTGQTGNRLDGPALSAISVPEGVSDNCPAGVTIPARIVDDVVAGDVGLCRFVNNEASVLELGDRSVGLQAWYGFKRVDDSDVDTTFEDPPDPDDHIVDTGAVHAEFFETAFVTVTLPGDDRTFTYGPPKFSEKGWPLAVLAVRQDDRRVPYWTSPTWHDFSFIYSGFHSGATFVQVLINRNGIVYGPIPSVTLPGSQDIDGPDVTWDQTDGYYTSTAWGVYIFAGTYLLAGPILNPPAGTQPDPTIVPTVNPPGTPGGPGTVGDPDETLVEGGSGGGFEPPGPGTGGEDVYSYIL